MESEKVKEIKKGLKFMMGLVISNKLPYIDGNTPKQIAYEEIFNYINELESENDRLSNTEIGELIEENEKLAKQCEDWCEIILKKRNQIVELKDRIAELEKENKILQGTKNRLTFAEKTNIVNNAVEIKLKQFAERLKEISCEMYLKEQLHRCIDETLKEFIK